METLSQFHARQRHGNAVDDAIRQHPDSVPVKFLLTTETCSAHAVKYAVTIHVATYYIRCARCQSRLLLSEGRAWERRSSWGVVCSTCSKSLIDITKPGAFACLVVGDSWYSENRRTLMTHADSDAVMRCMNTCVKMGDGSWKPLGVF